MIRTIAITGATGFAGRHTVAALLGHEFRVRALVRNPNAAELPAAVETVTGDLHNLRALDQLLSGAEAVVHLAGAISALTREAYFDVNARGTMSLIEAARRAGLRRFVHISSLSAREPALSDYGASKRAGEEAVVAMTEPLNAVILRPPAVYGPGDKATLPLLKELTKRKAAIPGRRDARFSLIHAGDLARFIVMATGGTATGLHEVSDQTPRGYRWADLIAVAEATERMRISPLFLPRGVLYSAAIAAETWSRMTGKPGMMSRAKVRELYHTDWVAREGSLRLANPVTFVKGFPETINWYRTAGWLPQRAGADRTGSGT